jgi:hypothetical protein
MSFYSRWQAPVDEHRQTALVFGFLRHAPLELALASHSGPLLPFRRERWTSWPRDGVGQAQVPAALLSFRFARER